MTDIWRGIWITGEAVSKPKVTINYPFEKGEFCLLVALDLRIEIN